MKHFLMMMEQISDSASLDIIIGQILPTFYPDFNSQNYIVSNVIISYMNNVALGVGLLF